ncbi:hypothetical protein [Parasitella parasitica]|uniref:Chitin-binding type-2 domain-containing protein n=1 Tax=Parasitella parasitica TaxID=35722 RepID=A0A0B7NHG0_9FUNG|nr:hypothetical protein [Parasitella parasitica]
MQISLPSVIVILCIAYSVNAASIISRGEDVCKGGASAAGLYPVANSETQYIQCTTDKGSGTRKECPPGTVFRPNLRRCVKPSHS